ncbi:MAG: domain containing protein [Frankiales bacterium]|nr:domain containing protein [Frankiales bacterium]
MTQLVTGEAVALDVRTAGLPSRLLAGALDGLIQGSGFFLLLLALFASGAVTNEAAVAAMSIICFALAGLAYPVVLETLTKGRTVGKMAMGLRVVRDDAGPIAFRQAFVRGLIGFLVEKPGVTLFAGGVISGLVREDGKRLGDLAAGTVVIQERVISTQAPPVLMPGPLVAWAATLDLSRLSDDVALAVRTFLARSAGFTDAARTELGGRLVAAVAAVVTPEPPPGTPEWAYLSAVLAERRRRAEALLETRYVPPATATPQVSAPSGPPPPVPSDGFAAPF